MTVWKVAVKFGFFDAVDELLPSGRVLGQDELIKRAGQHVRRARVWQNSCTDDDVGIDDDVRGFIFRH